MKIGKGINQISVNQINVISVVMNTFQKIKARLSAKGHVCHEIFGFMKSLIIKSAI